MFKKNNWLGLVFLGFTLGCNQSTDEILIGEVGSMTGAEAAFGISNHQGVLLAQDELNQAGGVHNKKIKVITLDNQSKSDETVAAMTNLITQKKVIAVLGEVASSRTLAMAPIAQQYKVPLLTPSSTNTKITQTGDYVFRTCFNDSFQGVVLARFALETLKIKKVALLKDIKNDHSVSLSEVFIETFKKGGGSIIAEQSYSWGDVDFKAQLTTLRASKPEALFVPGYYTEVGLIARQAKELGFNVPLFGGDGWDSPKLIEIGGAAMDGNYYATHYSQEDPNPRVQEFITKYKARFGDVPDAIAALGYDALKFMAQAMKNTQTLTPENLRLSLAQMKNFVGVTGIISLDAGRNATKSAVILKVESSRLKHVRTLDP